MSLATQIQALATAIGTEVKKKAVNPLPAGITGTGTYDPRTHTYTPVGVSLGKAKASLAGLKSSRAHWAVAGASNVSGWDGSTSHRGIDDFPLQLRNALQAAGYPTSEGVLSLMDQASSETRYTNAVGTWGYNSPSVAISTQFIGTAGAGAITANFAGKVDTIAVRLSAISSPVTLTVDGALVTTFASLSRLTNAGGTLTPDGTNNPADAVFTVPLGTHAVTITSTGSMYPIRMRGYAANALEVSNFGESGSSLAMWADTQATYYSLQNRVINDAPDVLIFDFGLFVNSFDAGQSTAQMKAAAITAINTFKAAGIEVILNSAPPIIDPIYGAPPIGFWQAQFDVADTTHCILIDQWTALGGTWAATSALGYGNAVDQVHQSTRGMTAVAQNIVEALGIGPAAIPASSGGGSGSGVVLPSNAFGELHNDGSGALSWHSTLPMYLRGVGSYDAPTNVYTPTNTTQSKLAAKMAQVAAGTGQLKVAAAGPSTVAGYNGSAITRGWGDWPALLRGIIEANGYTVGEGALRTNDYLSADSRWGFSGTWANQTSGAAAVEYGKTVTSGASGMLNPTRPGTTVEFEVGADSGPFTLTVDTVNPTTILSGGVAATISVSGHATVAGNVITPDGTANWVRVTVAGLPFGLHYPQIAANSTTAVKLYGLDFFPPNSVRLANFGASGAITAHWSDRSAYNTQLNLLIAWGPDVCIFDMAAAVNDYNAGTANATIKANLIASIQALQGAGTECILIAPLPFLGLNGHPTPGASDPFWQIFIDVADTTGCPMIDLFDRWGADYTKPAANGLIGADNFHPNAAGYADIAQAIAQFMRINSQQAPTPLFHGMMSPHLRRTGAIAETFPRHLAVSATQAMSGSGIPRAVAIALNKGDVVNTITFKVGTTGAGTPTHHWAALLYENGKVLAASTDKLTAAIAASAEMAYAMAAPWTALVSGLYYLVWGVSATTMPTMLAVSPPVSATNDPPILAGTAPSSLTPPAVGASLTLTAVSGLQYGYVG